MKRNQENSTQHALMCVEYRYNEKDYNFEIPGSSFYLSNVKIIIYHSHTLHSCTHWADIIFREIKNKKRLFLILKEILKKIFVCKVYPP